MNDLKLALVGYLNTKPFEYGLKSSELNANYSIYYDTPANCVKLFKTDSVDVALVPVGALPEIDNYRIVTETCIGCDDEVRTVVLMSDEPIEDWTRVILDSHSRSSALLTQILLREHFNISPSYATQKIDQVNSLEENQAVLMIGDKVFENEGRFKYSYDLGHYWKAFTGLSFAYAVWIAKDHVDESDIIQLNEDLLRGIDSIEEVIEEQNASNIGLDLAKYYRDHIDYHFDESKKKALKLYLEKAS